MQNCTLDMKHLDKILNEKKDYQSIYDGIEEAKLEIEIVKQSSISEYEKELKLKVLNEVIDNIKTIDSNSF